MLDIQNISLQRGQKVLLQHASLTLYANQRTALIGKNGTGKSSLFALIRGEILPDSGDIILASGTRIASVKQETPSLSISALDYVLQGDAELQQYQHEKQLAEQQNDGHAIAHWLHKLEEIDAYTANARASKLLNGLGFSQQEHQKAVSEFSGGWRMRLNLAQALMCRSDLLLLDEPTNHLDLETILWLEGYLNSLNNAQLIISHDRDFLNTVTTQTIELTNQNLVFYGGNYDFYQKKRAELLTQQQNAYKKQQQEIAHLQTFINRFRAKATKATQVQSRIKALAKIEQIAPAHLDSGFSFSFFEPDRLSNPLLKLDKISFSYQENQPILKNISLSIETGSRYGLLGVNGSGKSTLIQLICGKLIPKSGQIVQAQKLKIGYFSQHQLDTLHIQQSPIWHIQQLSSHTKESDIRQFLGGFGFSGDMATDDISHFSGGEKARLALAILVWQKPDLLLLDEPTNHLDLDMRHALILALQSFQGAMILVSHDRSLLETTCDTFLLLEQGLLNIFDGDLQDYRRYRLQKIDNTEPKAKKEKESKIPPKRRTTTNPQKWQLILKQSEQRIEELTTEKEQIEAVINSPEAYNEENRVTLQNLFKRLPEVTQALEEQEMQWLEASEALDNL